MKDALIQFKTDQEPAIVDMRREIQKTRECEYGTAMEQSRVGDSDSNGTIENAVSSVEGVARTLRIALEERVGQRIQASDPESASRIGFRHRIQGSDPGIGFRDRFQGSDPGIGPRNP